MKKILKIFTVSALAIVIAAFSSCKKDDELMVKDDKNIKQRTETSSFNPNKIENMDEYLLDFIEEIKTATRDSEPMSVENAEWHLSACLNFMYCNANVGRTHVFYDTITTTINVNDGYISLNDINSALEEISSEVSIIYNTSDVENKNLLLINSEIQDEVLRGGTTVRTVVGISGRNDYYYFIGSLTHPDPFELNGLFTEYYYHWEDEAPDTLEQYINLYIPDASFENERIYYTSFINDSCTYLNSPGRLFYCDNCSFDCILFADEMRYYLDSYLGLIEENTPPSHMHFKISSTIEPRYYDYDPGKAPVSIHHVLIIKYGIPISTDIETN